MKILIAEDDHIYSKILEAMLLKWGYEIIVCNNGVEVLKELEKENAPKLLILDWMMPVMDGVEVCKTIRKTKKEPYIYILLLTAKDERIDIVEGISAGADDYVTKPFHAHELQARLRTGMRILELQDELISSREILRKMAAHAPLPGALKS